MRKQRIRPAWFALVLVPLGGLVMLALTFLLYGGVYNLLESIFFPTDPQSFPADQVRTGFAVVLAVVYLALYLTRLPELLKAVLLFGPVAMLISTAILDFYLRPFVFIPLMLAIPAACAGLLYRAGKPWVYFYALALASLAAIAYAWPRPGF